MDFCVFFPCIFMHFQLPRAPIGGSVRPFLEAEGLFFLHGTAIHRVLGRGQALTLYVRGRRKVYGTLARSAERQPAWGAVASREMELNEVQAAGLLRQAAHMLRCKGSERLLAIGSP